MGERYFVLTHSEDGAGIKGPLTKRELNEYINEENGDVTFLDRVPSFDGWCWTGVPGNSALIIKGSIVTPHPVEVITKWEVH